MRLFEAIIDANHRAVAGDKEAGLHPAEFENELPVIALTCVDPRLNAYFPNALSLPAEQFIWLRNAGNIITAPLSGTMRSLALACAVKGGKEIAIIGHTDCQICTTTTMQLLDKLKVLGVERNLLPENINEFFGMFASERQNVIKAVDIVRHSPLIGPKIPVHGLLMDIETGNLDWIVNGYQALEIAASHLSGPAKAIGQMTDALESLGSFNIGEMKFPETKIGELATKAENWLSQKAEKLETELKLTPPAAPTPAKPPKIPIPPPIRPRPTFPTKRR